MPARHTPIGRTTLLALAALTPAAARASVHADLGGLPALVVALPWLAAAGMAMSQLLALASPFLLLGAAYLFWKKDRGTWLFACVAAPVGFNLTAQLINRLGLGGAQMWPVLAVLQLLMLVSYSTLLIIALRAAPGSRSRPASAGGRRP